jgi:hypothetical protein
MKRRSKAGDALIKGRRRKAPKPKRRNAPKTAPRSKSSPSGEDTVVARLTHELRETTEQHTATAEMLRVISSSPKDLQPVFQVMLKNAARLCDAKFGNIYRWDGDALHLVATQNVPAASDICGGPDVEGKQTDWSPGPLSPGSTPLYR